MPQPVVLRRLDMAILRDLGSGTGSAPTLTGVPGWDAGCVGRRTIETDPPRVVRVHPSVTVGRSTIAGDGLFARDHLCVGTIVLRLGGRLVSSTELAALLEAATADAGTGYVDTITVYEDRHLVLPPRTLAHWCNHSCDPNLWHVGPYEIAARKAIRPGEELTVDYGTHSGAPGFRMRCSCGSAGCRREISGDDWRRPGLQERYGGHWTPALQCRIDRMTTPRNAGSDPVA
ncbi:MAG TPA: SET domain-containing protein-lysine N-methyltransferase [Acidimicrobiales bacterium]|nr:SET domain-containing protein-lysine N-methyltransferase [Acidimicrobiales bacterium]